MKEFYRKLRLVENVDITDNSLVRNTSNFTPSPERNAALDKFILKVEDFQKTKPQSNWKPNLTKSESNAIKALKSDDTIIIKEADKGSTTVIMGKQHYREMVNTMISDMEYYETLDKDPHRTPGKSIIHF